ncbi:MAG: hypothetical protein HY941_07840 [Gammaproteobacteria bacterium]|nr:hypothetical protein [Gammaproteobacteria bacterium]
MRRLQDIHNELERAVFLINYKAPRQRLLRLAATALIVAKHGLRGLLYVWPLTLLLFVDLPAAWYGLRIVLILLAIGAWFRFIYGSVRDDCRRFVYGRLLEPAGLKRML